MADRVVRVELVVPLERVPDEVRDQVVEALVDVAYATRRGVTPDVEAIADALIRLIVAGVADAAV